MLFSFIGRNKNYPVDDKNPVDDGHEPEKSRRLEKSSECHKGHELEKFTIDDDGCECDVCGANIELGEIAYTCNDPFHSYDIHVGCMGKD